ncbi:MAG: hypothetical protein GX577_10305 [Leptolinea sp.]|mgnify:CR=1 FL=1|nr:hypothetical protein [Leptolinea sp.]
MPEKKAPAGDEEKKRGEPVGNSTGTKKDGKSSSPPLKKPSAKPVAVAKQEPVKTQIEPGEKAGIWWIVTGAAVFFSLVLGYILCHFLQVMPLQQQLSLTLEPQVDVTASSNQVMSELSTTRLRQQEMEIRYLKASAELESANKHIFLLRMKEQVVFAELMIEQKNGMEARKALAELKTLYDNIRPYIVEKNRDASQKLEVLIQTAIQDLTGDPDTAIRDIEEIREALRTVETALF